VYAPDAATAELSRWREERDSFSGFVMPLSRDPAGGVSPSGARVRVLALSAIQPLLPYPVARTYLVAEDSAGAAAPVRVGRPPLGDGPHLSYAIQWFCFAAIAIGGAIIVAIRARRANKAGATGAYPEIG
jgi:cytochrome oxidase assembly protein ShyY1